MMKPLFWRHIAAKLPPLIVPQQCPESGGYAGPAGTEETAIDSLPVGYHMKNRESQPHDSFL